MLPSLICLILRHLEDPASTAQYHLIPNAILPSEPPLSAAACNVILAPGAGRHNINFWYHCSLDIVFVLSTHQHQRLPGFSSLRALHSPTSHYTSGITTVYRLYRTGHPRASSHSLPHHRYPAYCWVSRRHWHSYPIVGAPGALAS